MLHINSGHVSSISTSSEEFGEWGKALIVSSKVERLLIWTKNPPFPPPQPLDSPHLAIHYPLTPKKLKCFLLVYYCWILLNYWIKKVLFSRIILQANAGFNPGLLSGNVFTVKLSLLWFHCEASPWLGPNF